MTHDIKTHLADLMRAAGFTIETVQPLLFGVAHLYVGVAPA